MRVYVAGPVTGVRGLNRFAFEDAADQLAELGLRPVVPHWFVPPDAEWRAAMRSCIETLVKCDGVCLLPGWRASRGAQTEYLLAMRLGMDVRELRRWLG